MVTTAKASTSAASNIDRARQFAMYWHGDQKYGHKPYVYHLNKVAGLVARYGDDAVVLAYLHDVLEDTDARHANVMACFGVWFADMTLLLSDPAGKNRKERKAKFYKVMSSIDAASDDSLALIVKAADRLANMEECLLEDELKLNMYLDEYDDFKEAVYRKGLCEDIWTRLEQIVDSRRSAA